MRVPQVRTAITQGEIRDRPADHRSDTGEQRSWSSETSDEGSRALDMGVGDRPDTPSYSFQSLPLPGTPSALPQVLVLSPPPRNPASSADWSLACRGAESKGRDVTGGGADG